MLPCSSRRSPSKAKLIVFTFYNLNYKDKSCNNKLEPHLENNRNMSQGVYRLGMGQPWLTSNEVSTDETQQGKIGRPTRTVKHQRMASACAPSYLGG